MLDCLFFKLEWAHTQMSIISRHMLSLTEVLGCLMLSVFNEVYIKKHIERSNTENRISTSLKGAWFHKDGSWSELGVLKTKQNKN